MENEIPNLPQKTDKSNITTGYFNNFFKAGLTVNQNVDNAILTYFETVTGNKDAAITLASTVLYTALTQGIDPVQVLSELNKLSKINAAGQASATPYNQRVTIAVNENAKPGPNQKSKSNVELNAYLAMFLNLNRVNTSLLGISNAPPVNKYVQRAILP